MRPLKNSVFRHENLELHILPLRSDNYSYVVHDSAQKKTLVIDPSETLPIVKFLEEKNFGLDWILDTHHHNDHIEGNKGLKERFGAQIAAPAYDVEHQRITADEILRGKEDFDFAGHRVRILDTPGHTLGHVSLYWEDARWLFSGDTLFSLGCGRLFEGDAKMLWQSFQKYRDLSPATLVFCGHEYTLANARFVQSLQLPLPDFDTFVQKLEARSEAEGKTIPSQLSDEWRYNPYFLAKDAKTFGEYRALKDKF